MKKIWIIAGEASGDLYGARLAEELRLAASDLQIQGMGGPAMQAADIDILVDSTELGIVGLVEVLKHYPMFRRIFNGLVQRAADERPDVVILIDYPGFNLRLAKKLKGLNIPVVYYVCPQVWAWGKRRIPEIAAMVSRMLVIFPFEVDVFKDYSLDTRFVGHPLLEIMEARKDPELSRDPKLVLLLPGSRVSEVQRLLQPLLATAERLHKDDPSLRFVIPTPRPAIQAFVERELGTLRSSQLPLEIDSGQTEIWMQKAIAGIAASGTVTVQSAMMGLPLVVVYRLNPLTYLMGRMLVKVPYITMVNLVAETEVFQEFIQNDVEPTKLADALRLILPGGERRVTTEEGMAKMVSALSTGENPSRNAARAVLDLLNGTSP